MANSLFSAGTTSRHSGVLWSELGGSLAIPRCQSQWLSSGDAEAQLRFELLSYASPLVLKGLNIDWDSYGIK